MPHPKGKTRECSKCKGDLGNNHGKQRYCNKCRADYARQFRRSRADVKYNEAIEDVLKLLKSKGYNETRELYRVIKKMFKDGKHT